MKAAPGRGNWWKETYDGCTCIHVGTKKKELPGVCEKHGTTRGGLTRVSAGTYRLGHSAVLTKKEENSWWRGIGDTNP